jgi:hypothetical protein
MLSRIAALPRRVPLADADALVEPLTAWLRAPTGTMQLRPIQAAMLAELGEHGGLFAAVRVGGGKTIPAALGATVVGAERPLLILPAGDIRDKIIEYRQLRRHWRIPSEHKLKIISYHKLSRAQRCPRHGDAPCECIRPTYLDEYQPDYIGCDEAQALRYPRRPGGGHGSACARKFAQFAASPAGQRCKYAFFSGTPARQKCLDYFHMLVWALKENAPCPLEPDVQEEWSDLIDDPSSNPNQPGRRLSYSVLVPHLGPVFDRSSARDAYADRLEATPGVIISRDEFDAQPLSVKPLHVEHPPALDVHWTNLRKLWMLPDGWLLADKTIGVWSAAQQLACGFYYTADPWPPDDWVAAYKQWAKFCRAALETETPGLDSELQVKNACRAGTLDSTALEAWEAIAPSFTRHTVAVWLSTHMIEESWAWGVTGERLAAAGTAGGSIIWSSWSAFGKALAERTGWPYYGAGAKDSRTGGRIARADAPVIIASTKSCTTSKNLQVDVGPGGGGYSRNLFVTPPQKSLDWEQRIGRTHRELQRRPVTVDYCVGCLENFVAPIVGVSYAQRAESIERQPQKLLHCDLTTPPADWAVGPAYGE